MSLGLRSKTINVKREDLVAALQKGLETHRQDYVEAVVGYRIKLLEDLARKISEVNATSDDELKNLRQVSFGHPVSHEKEYVEAIDFYAASVDDKIELNNDEFRAYFKNEWSWSDMFNNSTQMYKGFAGSIGGKA